MKTFRQIVVWALTAIWLTPLTLGLADIASWFFSFGEYFVSWDAGRVGAALLFTIAFPFFILFVDEILLGQ